MRRQCQTARVERPAARMAGLRRAQDARIVSGPRRDRGIRPDRHAVKRKYRASIKSFEKIGRTVSLPYASQGATANEERKESSSHNVICRRVDFTDRGGQRRGISE